MKSEEKQSLMAQMYQETEKMRLLILFVVCARPYLVPSIFDVFIYFLQVVSQDAAPVLAVSGVFFVCPFCSSSYGRRDIRNHMEECLRKVQTL